MGDSRVGQHTPVLPDRLDLQTNIFNFDKDTRRLNRLSDRINADSVVQAVKRQHRADVKRFNSILENTELERERLIEQQQAIELERKRLIEQQQAIELERKTWSESQSAFERENQRLIKEQSSIQLKYDEAWQSLERDRIQLEKGQSEALKLEYDEARQALERERVQLGERQKELELTYEREHRSLDVQRKKLDEQQGALQSELKHLQEQKRILHEERQRTDSLQDQNEEDKKKLEREYVQVRKQLKDLELKSQQLNRQQQALEQAQRDLEVERKRLEAQARMARVEVDQTLLLKQREHLRTYKSRADGLLRRYVHGIQDALEVANSVMSPAERVRIEEMFQTLPPEYRAKFWVHKPHTLDEESSDDEFEDALEEAPERR